MFIIRVGNAATPCKVPGCHGNLNIDSYHVIKFKINQKMFSKNFKSGIICGDASKNSSSVSLLFRNLGLIASVSEKITNLT